MVLITIVMGVYKPTHNWGAPHCIVLNNFAADFPTIPVARALEPPLCGQEWCRHGITSAKRMCIKRGWEIPATKKRGWDFGARHVWKKRRLWNIPTDDMLVTAISHWDAPSAVVITNHQVGYPFGTDGVILQVMDVARYRCAWNWAYRQAMASLKLGKVMMTGSYWIQGLCQ